MNKTTFLLLLSMNKENAAAAKAFLSRINKSVDATASPVWVDSRGIGVLISTDLSAKKVWHQAWPDTLTKDQAMDIQDFLIVEVGPDWEAKRDSKHAGWLNSRYPKR